MDHHEVSDPARLMPQTPSSRPSWAANSQIYPIGRSWEGNHDNQVWMNAAPTLQNIQHQQEALWFLYPGLY